MARMSSDGIDSFCDAGHLVAAFAHAFVTRDSKPGQRELAMAVVDGRDCQGLRTIIAQIFEMNSPMRLPSSPFSAVQAIALTPESEPMLQAFFEANPAYFWAVQGEPATPGEAREEIHEELPPEIAFAKKWLIGYANADGGLIAMVNLLADIFSPGVWNISTFILASARHGTGDAQALYASVESWAKSCGACWLRLGVVGGNSRAERFWETRGFVQTRERHNYQVRQQVNTLRVMYKPLCGGDLEEYLSLVPRDRPMAR